MDDCTTPAERRTTLRLLAYWEKLRGGRMMPEECDIKSEDIFDLWDYCFLLRIRADEPLAYTPVHIGKQIRDVFSEIDAPLSLHEHIARIVNDTLKPVLHEGQFRLAPDCLIKYRQCLLPLGEDKAVQAIFGAIRSKAFRH